MEKKNNYPKNAYSRGIKQIVIMNDNIIKLAAPRSFTPISFVPKGMSGS